MGKDVILNIAFISEFHIWCITGFLDALKRVLIDVMRPNKI